jgi:hypothetical protein
MQVVLPPRGITRLPSRHITDHIFAMGLPIVIAGTWVGFKLFVRINETTFRKIVLALLFFSGAVLVF